MIATTFVPGVPIDVMAVDNSSDLFTAVIAEVDEHRIIFHWSEGDGPIFPPRVGAFVRLLDDADLGRAYAQDASVTASGATELVVEVIGQAEPYERRAYKRVSANLPLRCTVVSPSVGPPDLVDRLERLEKAVQRIAAHLGLDERLADVPFGLREVCEISLSGGGASLAMHQAVPIGDEVEIDLELPLHPIVHVRTALQVVRNDLTAPGDSGSPRWIVGGRFDSISGGDRASVVRYTAQRERELARSGTPLPG